MQHSMSVTQNSANLCMCKLVGGAVVRKTQYTSGCSQFQKNETLSPSSRKSLITLITQCNQSTLNGQLLYSRQSTISRVRCQSLGVAGARTALWMAGCELTEGLS